MTVTIGSFSTNRLTAQPFGYEGEARTGLTARTFRISGLLTPSEWQTLVSEYNSWRSSRILDQDTLLSGVVGTTISVTITTTNNLSVSGLACWFADAPAGEQAGKYVSATVTLVDAAQALEVLLREKEKSRQNSEANLPNLGTVSLGGVTITLTKPAQTLSDLPNVSFTAGGKSYITGPIAVHEAQQIEGYISNGSYSSLVTWAKSAIASGTSPFPTSAPSATAESIIVNGVKSTRYNVQLTVITLVS